MRRRAVLCCLLGGAWRFAAPSDFARPARLARLGRAAGPSDQPPPVQPPQLARDPPVETGRNPQAVAQDFVWGIVSFPLIIFLAVAAYLFTGFVGTATKPPPDVSLSEALMALTAIEDDFGQRGPSMGLRARLARWFQWSEPQRRLDWELDQLDRLGVARTQREKIRQRGVDAAEDIAQVVEYFIAGNGIIDDSGSAKFADRIASEEASRGYPEAEKFAEKALHEGRRALAETVAMIEEVADYEDE
ncbi:unnamed protein product [Effrenium voratum]|nr:unnamed protein product [Effrenium voratum]